MAEETTPFISAEILQQAEILDKEVYRNKFINYYWSLDWTPSFYIELAYAGFISVAMLHNGVIPVLLPEIQFSYAVLDWTDLHISRNIRKMVKTGVFDSCRYYIILNRDCTDVAAGISANFGESNWMSAEYVNLLQGLHLPGQSAKPFQLFSVELRDGRTDRLVAGEIGYTIGRTYTSLSGFFDRSHSEFNRMGTVQLICLAGLLERSGYAFWNLGHPQLKYKMDLGAKEIPREEFLERWKSERDSLPETPLGIQYGTKILCRELIQQKIGNPII